MSDKTKLPNNIPLGQHTDYISHYSPELLFPISRAQSRASLSIAAGPLPFSGMDIWTGYELSWLDDRGKPHVAVADFRVPCESEFIVESKSFKLYLNSFNQTAFAQPQAVLQALESDLSTAVGAPVLVQLTPLRQQQMGHYAIGHFAAENLDHLPVTIEEYHPSAELLAVHPSGRVVQESLCSDLLKSNCPVTGQPDWASVYIRYTGPQIDREGLLKYIISFREHQDFHEHCVERMFMDIASRCQPEALTVYARYTRRGGLDINPFRTNCGESPMDVRLVRQ